MIAAALLIAAAPVPQSALDRADAAGLAFTQCLFATFRSARQALVPAGNLGHKLRSECSAQARQVRSASVKIFTLRGEPNPAASADRLIEDSYRGMVEDYRRLPKIEQQVRDFCNSDPQDCN